MTTSAPRKNLLIIDDDRLFGQSSAAYLADFPIDILHAESGKDGLAICRSKKIDIVLLDQKLPDTTGEQIFPSILSSHEQIKIIFITAYPDLRVAVEAVRKGAFDYLSKPFEPEELAHVVDKALKTLALEQYAQIRSYQCDIESRQHQLVGSSLAMETLTHLIQTASGTDAPVLITGETGTGKNQVARAIHYEGPKSNAPFISINCASLPENLIEAELFGYEKGAFTGADQTRKGVFELAEGGTLLLDEIGEIPLHLQSKLLQVLDEKIVRRLGGQVVIPVDVRIIAATNVHVEIALEQGLFRRDLYYRLSIIRIHLPPLRERREDISLLADHFIRKFVPTLPVTLSDAESRRLHLYDWPGNIRELSNVIERATILRDDGGIHPSRLIGGPVVANDSYTFEEDSVDETTDLTLKTMEKKHIERVLAIHSRNFTRTAQSLGVSRSTLMRKIDQYGI